MSSSRKVKGYIFRRFEGDYYGSYMEGNVQERQHAYVYTMAEIKVIIPKANSAWGVKDYGKWIVVYEDVPLLLPWQQPPVFVHE